MDLVVFLECLLLKVMIDRNEKRKGLLFHMVKENQQCIHPANVCVYAIRKI